MDAGPAAGDNAPMLYRVHVANRKTAAETVRLIQAGSAEEALRLAADKSVMVGRAEPITNPLDYLPALYSQQAQLLQLLTSSRFFHYPRSTIAEGVIAAVFLFAVAAAGLALLFGALVASAGH